MANNLIPTIEAFGWCGSTLLALCGLPQAAHSWRAKNSDGLTWTFLLMWFIGEVLTLAYIMPKADILPLLTNYTLNIMFLCVIIWFKCFPQRTI